MINIDLTDVLSLPFRQKWSYFTESFSEGVGVLVPIYQQFIRNTEDDDHQISAGQWDEVIVHRCVEVGAADDHIAHWDVPNDPRHKHRQVEDGDDDEGVGVLHLFGPEHDQKIFLKGCLLSTGKLSFCYAKTEAGGIEKQFSYLNLYKLVSVKLVVRYLCTRQ